MVTLNRKQQIINNLSCIYLCLMTVYTLLREVVVLDKLVGNSLLSYAFFGVGFLLIGAKWLYDRAFFQIRNIWILVGFLVVCVVSTLLNFHFELVSNIKAIGWMCIFFLLVYPSGYRSTDGHSREMNAIFITAVITMSVLVAVSLPMYFCDIDYTFYKTTGALTNQGFSQKYLRLWGVFQDANCAAVYCCVTLILALYLFAKKRNIAVKVLLIIAALSMVLYIVLTGSRTVQLVAVIVGAWAALYTAFTRINAKAFKRYALSILCCAISTAVLYFAFSGIRFSLPYVKYGIVSISNNQALNSIHSVYDDVYRWGDVNVIDGFLSEGDISGDHENELEILDRTDLEGKEDISNGRFTKWSDALKIFSESPLFGTSPRGISAFGKVYQPDTNIAKYGYSTHNFFLEILTGTGIVGLAVALLLLLKTASSILKITLTKRFSKHMLLLSSTVLMLVGASFFESDLFFILTFGGLIFWLMSGCIAQMTPEKNVHEGAENTENSTTPTVLVYGLKDPAGGVEKIVLDYVKNITANHNIRFDFLVFEDNFSKENEITEMGCRVVYMPSRKHDMRGYKRKMAALFAENRYCAVWGNYSGLTNVDVLVLAKRYNVPIRIAHSHVSRLYWGSKLMKYVVFVLHNYNKLRLAGYVTHYWACSEVSKRFMFPKSAQNDTVLIHNAVDTSVFYPDATARKAVRNSLGIDENAVVVGHVARMCEVKNQPFLLKSVSEAVKLDGNVRLLFVGDGELSEQLHREAEELGISDNVIFTGERTDVPSLLRAMDVFVLTSFSEGLSVSAVEAQASGLPCVLSSAVSPETDISGAVRFADLTIGESEWAKIILEQAKSSVAKPSQRIAESGYEISVQSEKLFAEFVGE